MAHVWLEGCKLEFILSPGPLQKGRLNGSTNLIEQRIERGTFVQTKGLTSIGSPSAVPVPCASRTGNPPPPSDTDLSSRTCDDPLGAVRDALGPSCYTAEPMTTGDPPLAVESTNAPQPSPRQYPSARISNV